MIDDTAVTRKPSLAAEDDKIHSISLSILLWGDRKTICCWKIIVENARRHRSNRSFRGILLDESHKFIEDRQGEIVCHSCFKGVRVFLRRKLALSAAGAQKKIDLKSTERNCKRSLERGKSKP